MVTAPIEAEDEINALQLNGLEILNRTIFPTAEEVWRYSPSMYPKKYTMKIEGLPILSGDEELEILAMPVRQILSSITRHNASKGRGGLLQFFDPKPSSAIFRSQTTECNFLIPNRNSSKSERSKIILFELSNFVYFITPLSNFFYYSSKLAFQT